MHNTTLIGALRKHNVFYPLAERSGHGASKLLRSWCTAAQITVPCLQALWSLVLKSFSLLFLGVSVILTNLDALVLVIS